MYRKLEQLQREFSANSPSTPPGLGTVIAAVNGIPSRSEAIEVDLQHFLGSDWQTKIPVSKAATAYVEHLQQLADSDPILLLPYVFSMHVPILLGFLGQRIQRTLKLPDQKGPPGLAFFTVRARGVAS